MYIVRPNEALRQYFSRMASAFPKQFKPDPDDYTHKMLIAISRTEASVLIAVVSLPPRLPVEIKLGGSVLINGHEIESAEEKLLVQSIVADLITAIDVITPHDKNVIAFHPTQQ